MVTQATLDLVEPDVVDDVGPSFAGWVETLHGDGLEASTILAYAQHGRALVQWLRYEGEDPAAPSPGALAEWARTRGSRGIAEAVAVRWARFVEVRPPAFLR